MYLLLSGGESPSLVKNAKVELVINPRHPTSIGNTSVIPPFLTHCSRRSSYFSNLRWCAQSIFSLKETINSTSYPHLTNYPSETDKACRTLLEKQGWAHKRRSPVEANTWSCKMWGAQQGPTLTSYAKMLVAPQSSSQVQWMIRKVGGRLSWIPVLRAQHDDDEANSLYVSTGFINWWK